eukprot:g15245.t1
MLHERGTCDLNIGLAVRPYFPQRPRPCIFAMCLAHTCPLPPLVITISCDRSSSITTSQSGWVILHYLRFPSVKQQARERTVTIIEAGNPVTGGALRSEISLRGSKTGENVKKSQKTPIAGGRCSRRNHGKMRAYFAATCLLAARFLSQRKNVKASVKSDPWEIWYHPMSQVSWRLYTLEGPLSILEDMCCTTYPMIRTLRAMT